MADRPISVARVVVIGAVVLLTVIAELRLLRDARAAHRWLARPPMVAGPG